jgi:arsenate reductase
MYTYLHNNRCSKSRAWLKLIEWSWKKYELRNYVQNPLDYYDLVELKDKLGLSVIDFVRTGEKEFWELWLSKDSSEKELLEWIAKCPKLLERPIVYSKDKAVIWRPTENIEKFILLK